MDVYTLPEQLQSKLDSELDSGEMVLWTGQPIAKKLAIGAIPLMLFGIPWTGFALFWVASANGFKLPDFREFGSYFSLFGIPFILIGILMLLSPLLVIRSAKKIVYVLTDRRAIIIRQMLQSFEIRSYRPEQLKNIYTREDKNGNGDVIFEGVIGSKYRTRGSATGFMATRGVHEVKRMIESLAESDI
jgi:hypothetical protein